MVRKPEIVHVKLASGGSFARKVAVGLLCRMRGVPVLVHVHGGGFDRFIAASAPPVRALARWMLEGEMHVVSLSDRWAQRLQPLFPRANISVVYNPVEVGRFADLARARFEAHRTGRDSGAPPMALFLGDIVERKGVYDLVRAWPEVVSATPGARLVMAGRGEIAQVHKLAATLGVDGLIETPGWVDVGAKRRLLGAATLFVLPSYFEGVPISLLEAMAAGLPSVLTPVGGVPDAVTERQEALFVPVGDIPALAHALTQVFASPELARALGGSARLRVEAFDLPAFADHIDRLYRSILAGRAAKRGAPARAGTARSPQAAAKDRP
jgi:glycosyltransferase involved in cell wall biosynthesis